MAQKTTATPHSWGVESWPADVYPHRPNRARYLINTHRSDLMAAGALVRVGRELVVLGAKYTRWLERQASRVPDFEIAPNRAPDAAA
jgi:hypothetical protein